MRSAICYSTNISTELEQYRIEGRSAKSLAASVEAAIAAGRLRPGGPLPSVRALAAELELSQTTVAAAFERLRTRGVIVTRDRSGSYVSWRPPIASARPTAVLPGDVRDVASGNPDPALLPDTKKVLRRLDPPGTLYGEEPVLGELRELGAAEFEAAGIPGEHLAVVSGALDGIERVLGARLRPGDLVAVEDPGYPGVLHLCRALGLALRPVHVDQEGMHPGELTDALREGAAAVIVTPRGQNPAGGALSERRARELRRVLGEAAPLVIEDDHLGPVAGAPRRTVISGKGPWAAARSTSKSLGPDLRLALLAGDAETIDRIEGRQLLGPQWVSHLLQRVVARLWADDRVAARLREAGNEYAARRETFLACLAGQGISATAASGLNVWIPVADEPAVVAALLERGWAAAPGGPFRLRTGPAIRVTTSRLDAAAAERLAAEVADAQRPVHRTRAA